MRLYAELPLDRLEGKAKSILLKPADEINKNVPKWLRLRSEIIYELIVRCEKKMKESYDLLLAVPKNYTLIIIDKLTVCLSVINAFYRCAVTCQMQPDQKTICESYFERNRDARRAYETYYNTELSSHYIAQVGLIVNALYRQVVGVDVPTLSSRMTAAMSGLDLSSSSRSDLRSSANNASESGSNNQQLLATMEEKLAQDAPFSCQHIDWQPGLFGDIAAGSEKHAHSVEIEHILDGDIDSEERDEVNKVANDLLNLS